jgi:hypothetical protein
MSLWRSTGKRQKVAFDPFSLYLYIAVLIVFLNLIADNKSVLLLYACAHKILKYLFPEKIAIEIHCVLLKNCFSMKFKGLSNKIY